MRNVSLVSLAVAVSVVSGIAAAEPGPVPGNCEGHPDLVDKCYETRGRLSVTNGKSGVRIWKVGTNRVLGVTGDAPETPLMPRGLFLGANSRVFADYTVCPFTKDGLGWMQMVCVESAKNIRVEEYDPETGETAKSFIEGPVSFN